MKSHVRIGRVLWCIVLAVIAWTVPGQGAEIAATAANVKPLGLGQHIPDVAVQTVDGKTVQLAEQLKGSKAMLIVFRGGWCPFCTRHLADVQSVYPRLRALGYTVYAFTNPDSGNDPSTGVAYDAHADQRSWAEMRRFFEEVFEEASLP